VTHFETRTHTHTHAHAHAHTYTHSSLIYYFCVKLYYKSVILYLIMQ